MQRGEAPPQVRYEWIILAKLSPAKAGGGVPDVPT